MISFINVPRAAFLRRPGKSAIAKKKKKPFVKTCIFDSHPVIHGASARARGVIEPRSDVDTTCLSNPRMYGSIFGIDPVPHTLQYNNNMMDG